MSALAGRAPASDFDALAREKLIVALDFSTIAEARQLVERLGNAVDFYKVGLGLQLAGGDRFARELKDMGKRVFLDYKYYDIEETIKNAVARAAELNIDFLTVHGNAKILRSAVEGKGAHGLKIFCVTVLTSMDATDFADLQIDFDVEKLVIHRAVKAMEAGCDGVIASANEAAQIKAKAGSRLPGNKLMVVTPGIRPKGASINDQKRTGTPAEAIRAGADYLVVGRPITKDPDPIGAAEAIVSEVAGALEELAS